MNTSSNIAVQIENVTKRYGSFTALHDVSLDIADNEFFTLLGPSGCGKTTLLRSIAGFEDISEGHIRLFGEDLIDLPSNKRSVNTVFQSYALFPHLSVEKNVMYGLQRLGKGAAETKARAAEVLELVQMTRFADRLPSQLSGGQQQRVALARALAPNPRVLLLDEPLSALDLKLRQAVRLELQQLQQNTGITFIFVTHDQEEALTMSDRIAVISEGRVQQIGKPNDIYEFPKNKFVADFIGETNLINVMVENVRNGLGQCVLPGGAQLTCLAADGAAKGEGHISVRPERVQIVPAGQGLLSGKVDRRVYLGTDTHVFVELVDGEMMTVRVQNSKDTYMPEIGAAVDLQLEADMTRLLVD